MAFMFSDPLQVHPSFLLPSRVLLSPLEGIMNRSFFFDTVFALELIDSWMPPFLSVSRGAVPAVGKLRKRFPPCMAQRLPLTVQLLGNDADALAETALRLAECGVSSVNLNFACPSRTVLGSGSGGALLREPARAAEIAMRIRRLVPEICLSVKLRSGFSSPEESREMISRLADAGVFWVIFHFRTVSENYLPLNRDEALRRIAAAVRSAGNLPVFGNGDILTVADAGEMREQTGCAGVAVGRGFLKNPFLLREIRGMPPEPNARKIFLDALLKCADSVQSRKKPAFYIECIKMAFGPDSEEFRAILTDLQ